MAPRTGDMIDGLELVKVEDYGHDTSLRYTFANGRTICAAHWDFDLREPGSAEYPVAAWLHNRKSHSNWGS